MLVQSITNLNNYQTKNCNIAKKHNPTNYAANTTVLPAFVDAKCYANINFKADIHDYAQKGDLDGVKRELAKGEDLNIKDIWGWWTPLHFACNTNYSDIVKFLCEQDGINLNIKSKSGRTPLHLACREGYLDIVKLLCEQKGIDLNIQDKDGWTPLLYAYDKEHLDTVKYLCEQEGIDLNIQNKDGWTPLHYACYNGHIDIVKLLCEQGADLNIQNELGWTPLYFAFDREHLDTVKYLCEQEGIDLNIQFEDPWGSTPLHKAYHIRDIDIVKLLCEQGVDVNIQDKRGYTPLHWACNGEDLDTVKYFCEQGADVNIQNKYGWTPLHHACDGYIGDIDIVKLLCEQGADVNIQTNDGDTPLHWACDKGHSDIVKLLCEQDGINLTQKNKSGKTPCDIAKDKGYQYLKWCKELEEKTKYQLAHPETIRKNKPLSKKQEAQEAQRLNKQVGKKPAEIYKFNQRLTQEEKQAYITKIETLARLLGQNPEITAENFEELLKKAYSDQVLQAKMAELQQGRQKDEETLQAKIAELQQERQKDEKTLQAKMAELDKQKQALEEEKQTFDTLMETANKLIASEVSNQCADMFGATLALFGISTYEKLPENLSLESQVTLVLNVLSPRQNKLTGIDADTPERITKLLQNSNENISLEGLKFLERIIDINRGNCSENDLKEAILSVKGNFGLIDPNKVTCFINNLSWMNGTIKTAAEKVKKLPR